MIFKINCKLYKIIFIDLLFYRKLNNGYIIGIYCFRYYNVSEIEYKDLVLPEETVQKEMAERLKLVDVQDTL